MVHSRYGEKYRGSLKTKNRIIQSSNLILGHIFRENHNLKIIITNSHYRLFIIAKTWKEPKCPLTDEWIKMWYIYTMEYYSAIKKKEIMSSAATWMDLEMIILISQKEKDKYHMISLIFGM